MGNIVVGVTIDAGNTQKDDFAVHIVLNRNIDNRSSWQTYDPKYSVHVYGEFVFYCLGL